MAHYPVVVAAMQSPSQAESHPNITYFSEVHEPKPSRSQKPKLNARRVALPYHWNPEKEELHISSANLELFLKKSQSLRGKVQTLILECSLANQATVMPMAGHLEPFIQLKNLVLKGPFKSLQFLDRIKERIERLALANTRLDMKEIDFLMSCIHIRSLTLERNAFLKPARSRINQCFELKRLMHLKLDGFSSWLFDVFSSEALPKLNTLDLTVYTVNDSDLKFFSSLKSLKTLNLAVKEKIILTRVAPTQSSSIHNLHLSFYGFMDKASCQAFWSYFPSLEVLGLEFQGKNLALDRDFFALLPILKRLDLGETAARSIRIDSKTLEDRKVQLSPISLCSRL